MITSYSHRRSEHGSGLFFIFLAVILFSVLTYAISQGGSGAKNISQEKNRLSASEIIDTGNRLSETASRLRLRGISDTQISFEYDGSYVNGGCLVDSCKVFAFDGGGLEWEDAPAGLSDPWGYTGRLAIQDIGTSAPDLVAGVVGISAETCHRINVLLGIEAESDSPPVIVTSLAAEKFTGSYIPSATISHAALNGQKSGCFNGTQVSGDAFTTAPPINTYLYYQVLAVR